MSENQNPTEEEPTAQEIAVVEAPETEKEPTEKDASSAESQDEQTTVATEEKEKIPETIGEASAPDAGDEQAVREADDSDASQAETPESQDQEQEPGIDHEADTRPSVAPAGGMIGYTGQIIGDVISLAELEPVAEPDLYELGADELREMIETTLIHVSEHEIVLGKIVSIGEKDVVIDIGFKSDGIVSRGEFDEEITAGEEVEVYLERLEDYHGQLVLSKTKADTVRRWKKIEHAYEHEEILEGTIVRRIKGGMIVELFEGLEAFLPGSQIDVRPVRDFDAYLEKRMEFKIVKLNPVNENIVVSHKALIEKDLQEQRQSILSAMEPGQILEGTVKNITDFGVFIDLGGVDGLLHITDLSWGRVSHPSELVKLDEQLNVVVLDYDKERQRISLGLKQLQPHPWEKIEEKYKPDGTVDGKVVSITDYGAFIELEKGIEGLVHISEMSWTEHIRHPSQSVSLGQMVHVKILNIDTEGKKISLGMKQLEPDPWANIAERYPPGTVMRGTVRNITNFGVFVEIEPGIDGLVHISDLSWTKRVRHPGEMVKKGQELNVVVLNIDTSDRRISLGHKQVDTNPWSQFAKVYAEGEVTSAKVVRIEDKGLVVELPLEVEAFIPTKELQNSTQLDDAYQIEETLENLIVIRFSAGQKEIVLSQKATERAKEHAERRAVKKEEYKVRKQEEKHIKDFQKKEEAASGPATLGELSGLADLKAKLEADESEVATVEAAKTAEAEDSATDQVDVEKPAEKKEAPKPKTRGRKKKEDVESGVDAANIEEAETAVSEEHEEADRAEEKPKKTIRKKASTSKTAKSSVKTKTKAKTRSKKEESKDVSDDSEADD